MSISSEQALIQIKTALRKGYDNKEYLRELIRLSLVLLWRKDKKLREAKCRIARLERLILKHQHQSPR